MRDGMADDPVLIGLRVQALRPKTGVGSGVWAGAREAVGALAREACK